MNRNRPRKEAVKEKRKLSDITAKLGYGFVCTVIGIALTFTILYAVYI